ncbi:hypothetical protein EDD86DRAFT_201308 [Gorgonomyces haynaldii]|nr:hypothetical protein EDD86DRAFT_201308 [Gorgonomyces haynaldii]
MDNYQQLLQDQIKTNNFLYTQLNQSYVQYKQIQQSYIRNPFVERRRLQRVIFPQQVLDKSAQLPQVLIPIRLELEYEGHKIRDAFTWNLYEDQITPEMFCKQLCEDLRVPLGAQKELVKSLREQIEDHTNHIPQPLQPIENAQGGFDWVEKILPEKRIIIKLDISIEHQCLVDQFEWDLANPSNSPEEFADILVREKQLVPEFKTAIAHGIREQVQQAAKSLLVAAHDFTSDRILDEDLATQFLPQVGQNYFWHQNPQDFDAVLHFYSEQEIEKMERDMDREYRRKRRQTTRSRRLQPATERDRPKTNRTPVPKGPPIREEPVDPEDGVRPRRIREFEDWEVDVNPHLHWQCSNCQKSLKQTTVARPDTEGNLRICNECWLKQNSLVYQ